MPEMIENKEEIKLLIKEHSDNVLLQLGITPTDLLEVHRDLMQLREWRKSMDEIKSRGFSALMLIVISGMLAALWIGIKQMVVK